MYSASLLSILKPGNHVYLQTFTIDQNYILPPFLPGIKRALFSKTLLITFREPANLVLIFKHNTVVFIYLSYSLSECNHGIPLTASRAIDSAKFSDCLRSKLHMLSPGPVIG